MRAALAVALLAALLAPSAHAARLRTVKARPLEPCHCHGEAGGIRRTKCVVDTWLP
jgi:hypothetical protein